MLKNAFLRGTAILFSTSILLRGLGFFYQIIIVRLIGTEPMGIVNMTAPFYMTLLVLVTAGLPVAIAKMTAEYVSAGQEIKLSALLRTAFLIIGGLMILAVIFACYGMPKIFSLLQTDERVQKCFYIYIPGLIIVPLASIMRGYFQGKQQMIYPALAQIAEQVARVVIGIVLVYYFKPFGVLFLAVGLTAAAMLGEAAGLLVIAGVYFYHRYQEKKAAALATLNYDKKMMQEMLSFGLPVTFTKLTSTIDMTIEATIIPLCLLAIGYNNNQAAQIYGQFSSVAISLLMIPTMLTGALATALVPAIAEAAAGKQKQVLQERCSLSIRLTCYISLPIIIALFCYGRELSQLLFHLDDIGAMLRILSLGAIFIYLGQTLVGILQGLGKTKEVFVNNFIGSASKLIAMYYFIKLTPWGVNGIAAGMVIGYGIQCLLNFLLLIKLVPIKIKIFEIIFVGINGIIFYRQNIFWQSYLPGTQDLVLLLSLGLSFMVYLLILYLGRKIKYLNWKT